MSNMFSDGGKWAFKLLTKQRKISAADHAYMQNNGAGPKVFEEILKLVGNKYSGKK